MQWKRARAKWQALAGVALGLLFIFLAFRRVDLRQMLRALGGADYVLLLPVLAVVVLGLLLRSLRWKFLLAPIGEASTASLFASLNIGYMANTALPAHLGEILRAWHAGRKNGISAGSVFATVVIERMLDVLSLLLLLALALLVFPFPSWVRHSGALMLFLVVAAGLLLAWMKKNKDRALALCGRLRRILPHSASAFVGKMLEQFLRGVAPLKRRSHYPAVAFLSILIWASYALILQLLFHAFDFVHAYRLPWSAALVAMVITTISVVVPSSPGYVGSFHLLCQLSLGLFAVPRGPALSYAFVLHAVSVFPPFFLGLFFLARDRISLRSLRKAEIHA
ncbi:MAG: flippase-like domain-containing protein, partial [Candidatus Aminicenantes bacterium]|nr:flippase-like domain-containing protein [Candidatus Aminicenantes bacterium]